MLTALILLSWFGMSLPWSNPTDAGGRGLYRSHLRNVGLPRAIVGERLDAKCARQSQHRRQDSQQDQQRSE